MEALQHNEKFKWIALRFLVQGKLAQQVVIHDAIIWLMSEETIDVATFGQNISATIISRDTIASYERKTTSRMKHKYLNIMINLD